MHKSELDTLGTRPNLATKMGGLFGPPAIGNPATNDGALGPIRAGHLAHKKNTKYKICIKNIFQNKKKKNNLCLFLYIRSNSKFLQAYLS